MAKLENAKYCLTTNSGVSSISIVLQLLNYGERVVVQHDFYNGTRGIITRVMNNRYNKIDLGTEDPYTQLESYLTKEYKDIKLVYLETPSNPMMEIIDLKRISAICKKYNVITAIDSTTSSPLYLKSLELGVDISIHACTKYIGGHSDCVGGVISTNSQ